MNINKAIDKVKENYSEGSDYDLGGCDALEELRGMLAEEKAEKKEGLSIFAKRVIEETFKKNITRSTLAKESDVSINTISWMLRSNGLPKSTTLVAIRNVLGISSDYLLGLSDVPKPIISTETKENLLADRLTKVMELKGFNVTKLARRANVSKPTITYLMNGKRMPSAKVVVSICKELNVSSDYLFGTSDSMEI